MAATIALLAALAGSGCDRSGTSPTSPSPVTSASALALDGMVVRVDTETPVAGAIVAVTDATPRTATTTTADDGRFSVTDLQSGTVSVRVTAEGYDAASQDVALSEHQSVRLLLRRTGATSSPSPSPSPAPSPAPDPSPGPVPNPAPVPTPTPSPQPEPVPTGPLMLGMTVDALTDDAIGGATIRDERGNAATSRVTGAFELQLASATPSVRVTVTSSATVERVTQVPVTTEPATLTLMPRRLDLAAFDQMFRRDGVLRRWTTTPRLVIQRRVLRFAAVDAATAVATAKVMGDEDVEALRADLLWTMPQLTGGRYDRFADVVVEGAAEGETVALERPGAIVVARFSGLTDGSTFWGYTRWAWNGAGQVQAAIVMLDEAFDASAGPYRRSLRAHELGHALGYNHVDVRPSVMDASGRVEPTDFDRDGSRFAFLRPTLNRAPDMDPDPASVSRVRGGGLAWRGAE
ncbi:MAG: carboxypeptidase regulatory-like domain-containing protein [Acidobacteria bacterium]|nr:carboxypeptidase regulatory-like domain-containing protein [Acidobacteriota bacterium]